MTFSRVARLLALLVVVAALWRARPSAAPAHVAVLLLPGADAGALSATAALASGNVRTGTSTTGAAFWRRLLTIEDDAGREPDSLPPLWETTAGAIRVSGVPSLLFAWPGGDGSHSGASAFVGSSAGAVVEYADLTAGRLPAPYDRAIEAVTAAAATLGKDQWSDWIRVTPAPPVAGAPAPPQAEFQFARVGDSFYLFSPAYVVDDGDVSPDPFLRGADRDQRPLLAAHVLDHAKRHDSRLPSLFGAEAGKRPVIVFEDVAEDVSSVFAPDTMPSSIEAEVAQSVASVIGSLRSAVGEDGVVFVVGGPTTGRPAGQSWFRILSGGSGTPSGNAAVPADLDFASARAMLRHLCGVSMDAAEKSLVPAPFSTRFPVKAAIARPAPASHKQALSLPWSAANLESLPGAVASGN